MKSIKVNVEGKNKLTGGVVSMMAEIPTSADTFSSDLGKVIFAMESAGFGFVTHDVYSAVGSVEDFSYKLKSTYTAVLNDNFNGVDVKVSVK